MQYQIKKFVPDEHEGMDEELKQEIQTRTEGDKDWDDGLANWGLRKIGLIHDHYNRLISTSQDEIDELKKEIAAFEDNIADCQAKKERDAEWFKWNLRLFLLNHPDTKDLETKTELIVARGILRINKPAPKITRPKAEASKLNAYVKKHRKDFYRIETETKTKEIVDWAGLKKEVQIRADTADVYDPETKEVIPGIVVEVRPQTFSVEVKI